MNALKLFRGVSALEGVSYLLLVFIAMPLKYGLDMPAMVKIVGAGHGALFILFVVSLLAAAITEKWGLLKPLLFFVASMIPFGFLFIEHHLRKQT